MAKTVRLGKKTYSTRSEIQRAAREVFLDTAVRMYPDLIASLRQFQNDVPPASALSDWAQHWGLDVPWFIEVAECTLRSWFGPSGGLRPSDTPESAELTSHRWPPNGSELGNKFVFPPDRPEPVEPLTIDGWSPDESDESERSFNVRVKKALAEYKKRQKALAAQSRIRIPRKSHQHLKTLAAHHRVRTPRKSLQYFEWLVLYWIADEKPTHAGMARGDKVHEFKRPETHARYVSNEVRQLADLIVLPPRPRQIGRPRIHFPGFDAEEFERQLRQSLEMMERDRKPSP